MVCILCLIILWQSTSGCRLQAVLLLVDHHRRLKMISFPSLLFCTTSEEATKYEIIVYIVLFLFHLVDLLLIFVSAHPWQSTIGGKKPVGRPSGRSPWTAAFHFAFYGMFYIRITRKNILEILFISFVPSYVGYIVTKHV
jgi:hypothetical protein